MSYLTCSGILMLKLVIPRDLPCLSLLAQSDWALRPPRRLGMHCP
jgi:hypothetical protein